MQYMYVLYLCYTYVLLECNYHHNVHTIQSVQLATIASHQHTRTLHACMMHCCRARVDGLVRREETQTQMVEVYKSREDFLCYKQVNFAARTKKFEPAETAYKRQIVVRACIGSFLPFPKALPIVLY